jgi:hypothetical protein
MLNYHVKPIKASLSSTKILEYITSTKIGDGSWHSTSENFILNRQEQICLFERLSFSDGQKLIMLQTATRLVGITASQSHCFPF